MGFTVKTVMIIVMVASLAEILRPTQGAPVAPVVTEQDGAMAFPSALRRARHARSQQEDRPVSPRHRREASGLPPDQPPRHHRGYLSQPPQPVDDGYNERSMCKWRYEDNVQSNRYPSTLKVAVKEYTGSRCRDPATGAPRADLACLPIDYQLNVLRRDSTGEWQPSVEYVTIGFTCAPSNIH